MHRLRFAGFRPVCARFVRSAAALATAATAAILLVVALAPEASAQDAAARRAAIVERLRVVDFAIERLPALPAADLLREHALVLDLEGDTAVIVLDPVSLRGPGFQLLVERDGVVAREAARAPATVQGRVALARGATGVVRGTVNDGSLRAVVVLDDGRMFGIQPVRDAVPGADPREHVVYRGEDVREPEGECAADELAGRGFRIAPAPPAGPPGAQFAAATSTCEIAFDADYDFYVKNGSSVNATMADVEAVLNGVEAIYEADVGVTYEITTILVRTSSGSNPYSTSSSSGLLDQFVGQWSSQHGSIHRDVAHLFTGRDLSGSTIGVAYISAVCKSHGFGLSQSRFSSNMTSRVALTAHELGHNWGANHCSGSDCKIMCAGLGGCSGVVTSFGTGSKNAILGYKASISGCLSAVQPAGPPQIASVSPGHVSAFTAGGAPLVTVAGDKFTGATQVKVGNATLGAGQFTVVNDDTIRFTPPEPVALGAAQVIVTTAGGTSNAKPLVYDAVAVPVVVAPSLASGAAPIRWQYGGDPFDQVLFSLNSTGAMFGFKGMPLLSPGVLAVLPALDAAGLGELTLSFPSATSANVRVQLWFVDPGGTTGSLEPTNVATTTVF